MSEHLPALRHDHPVHLAVAHFLVEEAALLDAHRWEDWLALLADDVRYVMPVRVSSMLDSGYDRLVDMAHFDEDRYSLTKRVQRLLSGHAWTEDPASRTRHLVTNIRAFEPGDDGLVAAESSLLLFRSRGDDRAPELVCARRIDRLRAAGDSYVIAARLIEVEESVLRTQNLAIFL